MKNIFYDKETKKRKSPLNLYGFLMGIVFMVIYLAVFLILTDPLHSLQISGHTYLTTALHAVIMSIAGTAVCLLFFLLPDKRIVPAGYIGLTIVALMIVIGGLLLEEDGRRLIMQLSLMYTAGPVIIGNLAVWPLYLKVMRYKQKDGVGQDSMAAMVSKIKKENKEKQVKKTDEKAGSPEPAVSAEAAMFGPEGADVANPQGSKTAQDEAFLLFEDEDNDDEGPKSE